MEGPGDPPAPDTTPDNEPSETPAETDTMPRNTKAHRNAEVDLRGEKRSNATHASTTDPDARLYEKARSKIVALAQEAGIQLRQTYTRKAPLLAA